MSHVEDTYVAALQHDLVEVPEDAALVGVVRRPTPWFWGAVDRNESAVGPPADLLDEVKDLEEEFKMAGICEEEANAAAWDEADFAERYRTFLERNEDAQAALDDFATTVREGTPVYLVCYENTAKKRCHRTILREALEERLADP